MSICISSETIMAASISENTWPSYGGRTSHHSCYKHGPPTEGARNGQTLEIHQVSIAVLTAGLHAWSSVEQTD